MKRRVSSSYGAAGSFAVLLLWVYYSSQLLFLGAEFTQVYSRQHGSRRAERQAAQAPQSGNQGPPPVGPST
ncbi:YhjD/YihY/BrkB family envelope integrity protein [Corallococcus aberystwythensis]|uniref:YhjD/YihY/BrkB family envelope integrity protein n=1 Tax=Corallococcus aberystwythensis TaxID=2316722 RepID=UPI003F674450